MFFLEIWKSGDLQGDSFGLPYFTNKSIQLIGFFKRLETAFVHCFVCSHKEFYWLVEVQTQSHFPASWDRESSLGSIAVWTRKRNLITVSIPFSIVLWDRQKGLWDSRKVLLFCSHFGWRSFLTCEPWAKVAVHVQEHLHEEWYADHRANIQLLL